MPRRCPRPAGVRSNCGERAAGALIKIEPMRIGEEFLLTYPVYIVLQAPGQPLAEMHPGGVHALFLFTDEPAADEWLRPGTIWSRSPI